MSQEARVRQFVRDELASHAKKPSDDGSQGLRQEVTALEKKVTDLTQRVERLESVTRDLAKSGATPKAPAK